MLKIDNLTKTFNGDKKAVDGLNLEVCAGDIYGFIGHNGAGKTTTIRAVVGVMEFDSGEISIDGHSVTKEPILCKSMTAYIPDNPDIYEYLTGIQYLSYICDLFGVTSAERETGIKKYCNTFEITGNLGNLISSYSHGMKQKLVITAALLHKPKLLVLDEPFVGLDPKAAFELKNFMRELCESGSAIFFSTHVLEVAEKLCTKIAIIKNGKLVISGKTEDVRGDSSLEQVFMGVNENE